MADMFDAVRLSDDEFASLCQIIDTALTTGEMTLVPLLDSFAPYELRIVGDARPFRYGGEELEDRLISAAMYLDQLMYYGIEGAPDSVIESWASDFDRELSTTAITRARQTREAMPTLRRRWESKTASRVPILVELGYETVERVATNDRSVLVSLGSGRVWPSWKVSESGVERLVLRLWEDDLYNLKANIDHILEAHLHSDEVSERDEDDHD